MAALSFLTVFPAIWHKRPAPREISDSRAYYPVVGLLLGLLLVGVERGAGKVFPPYLTAALLLALLVVVTRGLHLDGFMDVCDGLLGGYTQERRLEIMRDSHVGAFAVAGVASLLLVKYGALLSLLTLSVPRGSPIPWALLLFPMFSRWAMVIVLAAFPYARGQGLGSPFHQHTGKLATAMATVIAVVAATLLGGIGGAGMLLGVSFLAWLLGWAMARLLGGLTGDTYGAVNEVTEVAVLLSAVGLARYGLLEPLPLLLR